MANPWDNDPVVASAQPWDSDPVVADASAPWDSDPVATATAAPTAPAIAPPLPATLPGAAPVSPALANQAAADRAAAGIKERPSVVPLPGVAPVTGLGWNQSMQQAPSGATTGTGALFAGEFPKQAKNVATGAMGALASGVADVAQLSERISPAAMIYRGLANVTGNQQAAQLPGQLLNDYRQQAAQTYPMRSDTDPVAALGGSAVGSSLPSMMAGPAAPLVGAAQMAGAGYREAKDAGASELRALTAAALNAPIGLLDRFQFGGLFSKSVGQIAQRFGVRAAQGAVADVLTQNPALRSVLTSHATEFVKSVGTETGQQFLSNMVAQGVYDPNRALAEGLTDEAAGAAIIAAPFSMLGIGVNTMNAAEYRRAPFAELDEQPTPREATQAPQQPAMPPAPQAPNVPATRTTTLQDIQAVQTDTTGQAAPQDVSQPPTQSPGHPAPVVPPTPAAGNRSNPPEVIAPANPQASANTPSEVGRSVPLVAPSAPDSTTAPEVGDDVVVPSSDGKSDISGRLTRVRWGLRGKVATIVSKTASSETKWEIPLSDVRRDVLTQAATSQPVSESSAEVASPVVSAAPPVSGTQKAQPPSVAPNVAAPSTESPAGALRTQEIVDATSPRNPAQERTVASGRDDTGSRGVVGQSVQPVVAPQGAPAGAQPGDVAGVAAPAPSTLEDQARAADTPRLEALRDQIEARKKLGKRINSLDAERLSAAKAELRRREIDARGWKDMSDDQWLQATRFYRSGTTRNAELPNGQRVILNQNSTPGNFREASRDFLLDMRRRAVGTREPAPKESTDATRPAGPEPVSVDQRGDAVPRVAQAQGPAAQADAKATDGRRQQEAVETASAQRDTSTPFTQTDAAVKRPWEMTRREFRATPDARGGGVTQKRYQGYGGATARHIDTAIDAAHRISVEKALRDGLPVPSEVLKDYPDLSPQRTAPPPVAPSTAPQDASGRGTSTPSGGRPLRLERRGKFVYVTGETAPHADALKKGGAKRMKNGEWVTTKSPQALDKLREAAGQLIAEDVPDSAAPSQARGDTAPADPDAATPAQADLLRMPREKVRTIAKSLGIEDSGNKTRESVIDEILEKQDAARPAEPQRQTAGVQGEPDTGTTRQGVRQPTDETGGDRVPPERVGTAQRLSDHPVAARLGITATATPTGIELTHKAGKITGTVVPKLTPRDAERQSMLDSIHAAEPGATVTVGGKSTPVPRTYDEFTKLDPAVRDAIDTEFLVMGRYNRENDSIEIAEGSANDTDVWAEELAHAGYARLTDSERAKLDAKYGNEEDAVSAIVRGVAKLPKGVFGRKLSPQAAAALATRRAKPDQTQTPEFKRWFGQSVVTKEGKPGGEPMVVYRGGRQIVKKFDKGPIFLAYDEEVATIYGGEIQRFFARAINPLIVSDISDYPSEIDITKFQDDAGPWDPIRPYWITEEQVDKNIKILESLGYDSIQMANDDIGGVTHDTLVVFRPEQIKSATGNRGTFDPANPDIRFAVRRTPESIKALAEKLRNENPELSKAQSQRLADANLRGKPTERKSVEAQVREITGQTATPDTVTEPEALTGRMKGQQIAGKEGYKLSTGHRKLKDSLDGLNLREAVPMLESVKDTKLDAEERLLLEAAGKSWQGKVREANRYIKERYGVEYVNERTLSKSDIADLLPDETKRVAEIVRAFKHEIATHQKFVASSEARTIKEAGDDVAREIAESAKPLPERKLPAWKRLFGMKPTARDEGAGVRGVLSYYFGEQATRFEDILRERSATLHKLVYEQLSERSDVDHTVGQRSYDELEAVMAKHGHSMQKRSTNGWAEDITPVEHEGGEARLSRAERMHLAASAMSKDNREAILASGYNPTRLNTVLKFTEAQLEAVVAALSPAEMEIVDTIKTTQMNGWMKEQANAEWEAGYGLARAIEEDYFPMSRDMQESQTGVKGESLLGRFRRTLEGMAIWKERTGGNQPLRGESIFTTWGKHTNKMRSFIAYANTIRDINALLGTPAVKKALLSRYGEKFINHITNVVDAQANVGDNATGPVERFIRHLGGNASRAYLALRLTSAIVQPSSLILSAGDTNAAYLAKAIASRPRWSDIHKLARKYSPAWRARYDDYLQTASSGIAMTDTMRFGKHPGHYQLMMIQKMDEVVGATRWKMAEMEVSDTHPELKGDEYYKEVARVWKRLTNRSDNTSAPIEMSELVLSARRNPLLMPAMLFSSPAVKAYSMARGGFRDIANGNTSGGMKKLVAVLASLAFAEMMRESWKRLTSPKKEDDRRGSWWSRVVLDTIYKAVELFPVAGDMVSTGMRKTERYARTGSAFGMENGTFIDDMTDSVYTALSAPANAIIDYTQDNRYKSGPRKGEPKYVQQVQNSIQAIANLMALSTGVGLPAIMGYYRSTMKWIEKEDVKQQKPPAWRDVTK